MPHQCPLHCGKVAILIFNDVLTGGLRWSERGQHPARWVGVM